MYVQMYADDDDFVILRIIKKKMYVQCRKFMNILMYET